MVRGEFLSRIGTMSGSSGRGLDPYRSWCCMKPQDGLKVVLGRVGPRAVIGS